MEVVTHCSFSVHSDMGEAKPIKTPLKQQCKLVMLHDSEYNTHVAAIELPSENDKYVIYRKGDKTYVVPVRYEEDTISIQRVAGESLVTDEVNV